MTSYTNEERHIEIYEQNTGYSTNLSVHSSSSDLSTSIVDVISERSGLELALDNLERLKRNGKFHFKTAPFWSRKPIE